MLQEMWSHGSRDEIKSDVRLGPRQIKLPKMPNLSSKSKSCFLANLVHELNINQHIKYYI